MQILVVAPQVGVISGGLSSRPLLAILSYLWPGGVVPGTTRIGPLPYLKSSNTTFT